MKSGKREKKGFVVPWKEIKLWHYKPIVPEPKAKSMI